MEAFLASAAVVILAELGDKTQLLAIAFAAKFSWKTVMAGVFVSTVLNHFLAVVLGVCLGSFVDTHTMQILAALAFIIFGFWTIRGDKLDGEDENARFGPFGTVAVAFFLAEMGDKTQFATITLAAHYQTVVPVLLGTTTGMMLADGFGILVGKALYKVIPEYMLKWLAAIIFIGCGVLGLYGAWVGA